MVRRFGFPQECEHFEQRNQLFFERYANFDSMLKLSLQVPASTTIPVDRFLVFQGRLCGESFLEILLLAANGYGLAAQKLLRSLYENAVLLRYIHDNPTSFDNYTAYSAISNYKLLQQTDEIYGLGVISEEARQQAEANFQSVKDRFTISSCKKCGSTRLNHSWNKLDFVSMAKQTGELGKLLMECYYLPLRGTHATIGGLFDRLSSPAEHALIFEGTAQRRSADKAFRFALLILFDSFSVLSERFADNSLSNAIDECRADFHRLMEECPLQK